MINSFLDWGAKADEEENSVTAKMANVTMHNQEPCVVSAIKTLDEELGGKVEETENISAAEKSLLQKVIRRGLVENHHDLDIQRKDPNSPLYSIKTFEAMNLLPELLKGLYGMGFDAPSTIQETTIPTLLTDPPQNMIAQTQSGTEKTAAFVVAMLSRTDVSLNYPHVVLPGSNI